MDLNFTFKLNYQNNIFQDIFVLHPKLTNSFVITLTFSPQKQKLHIFS